MKTLLSLLLCAALLPSCMVARGQNWTFASFGTDAKKVHASADSLDIEELDQSTGMKIVGDVVKKWITMDAAVKMLRDGYAYLKHVSDNKIALYKAGTDRQIGLVNAQSAADVAKLDAAARNAVP